jgi:hypothetical protein
MALRERLMSRIPAVVLTVVALLQLTLAHAGTLTPWKGGGFGMFATVDSRGTRFFRVRVATGDGEVAVPLPPETRDAASRQIARPSRAGLAALAESTARTEWVADGDGGRPRAAHHPPRPSRSPRLRPGRPHEAEAVVPVRGARVELWRYSFDARTSELRAVKMDEASHAR